MSTVMWRSLGIYNLWYCDIYNTHILHTFDTRCVYNCPYCIKMCSTNMMCEQSSCDVPFMFQWCSTDVMVMFYVYSSYVNMSSMPLCVCLYIGGATMYVEHILV